MSLGAPEPMMSDRPAQRCRKNAMLAAQSREVSRTSPNGSIKVMHRITNTGRVNLGHLFWLRSLAIIGQLPTIAFVQIFFGVHLPLPAMLLVIALEVIFNGLTLVACFATAARVQSRTVRPDLGRSRRVVGAAVPLRWHHQPIRFAVPALARDCRSRVAMASDGVARRVRRGLLCRARFRFRAAESRQPGEPVRLLSAGMWVNFMVSVGLIAWFVARMSRALRLRDAALGDAQQRLLHDERAVALGVQAATVRRGSARGCLLLPCCPKNCATPREPIRGWRRTAPIWSCSDSK